MNGAHRLLDAAVLGQPEELAGLGPAAWQAVAETALQEGVAGLLFHRCAASVAQPPARIRDRLEEAYRQTAQHNIVALQELRAVLAGLADDAVDVVVMPGASLLGLYPDPACRPMDDIDLLVRPEDLERARVALRRHGFDNPPRHPDLWARDEMVLDLHGDLFNYSRVAARRHAGRMDVEEVFRNRRWLEVEGVPIRAMGLEDSVLYTSVHALRHSFSRLVWFLDLHLLLQEGPDWGELAERGRRFGLQRPLLYCLRYLRDHTAVDLSGPAAAWVCGQALSTPEQWALERAFRDRRHGEWGDLLWSFSVANPVRRCWFLIATCFPGPAVLLQVFPYLPRPLFPLAYGLRLGQLFLRGGRHLARIIRGAGRLALSDKQDSQPR